MRRATALLAAALATAGCEEEGRLHSHALKLDLSACLRLPEGAAEGRRSCGDRLDDLGDELTLCVALRGSKGEVLFPLRMALPSGEVTPAGDAPPLPLAGAEDQLTVRVYYLRPGRECDPEAFDVETTCSAETGCLMATKATPFQVRATGEEQVIGWGAEGLPCSFDCGDPAFCGAGDGETAVEVCDGADNDCDGEVDEGVLNACGECGPDPEEVCNGEDDDCDGQTDEEPADTGEPCDVGEGACRASGHLACEGGRPVCDAVPGTPEDEACDGADNDCDGETDEGLEDPDGGALGEPCIVGVGACERVGVSVCTEDGSGVRCNTTPGEPAERDRCGNDADDDCDGQVDEWEGGEEESRECVVGVGECQRQGLWQCNESTGEHSECSAQPGVPRDEVCGNGLDEDCDGVVDQGCACDPTVEDPERPGETVPETQPCYTGEPGTLDVGACRAGTQTCLADGTWAAPCVGEVVAGAESCNGVDDDCDRDTDEGLAPPPADHQDGVCAGTQRVCQGEAGWAEPDYTAVEHFEAVEVTCDGLDNDCDGRVDQDLGEGPRAAMQAGVCRGARQVCGGVEGWVEPDYASVAGYEAPETSCDGLDNDCDDWKDNGLEPPLAELRHGVCAGTVKVCQHEAGWAEPDYAALDHHEAVEVTCDGRDNDCDGSTDEAEGGEPLTRECYTGEEGTLGEGVCAAGTQECASEVAGETVWADECVGEVLPTDEENDPEDHDCDGYLFNGFALAYFDPQAAPGPVVVEREPALSLVEGSFTIEAWVWFMGFSGARADVLVSHRTRALGVFGYLLGATGKVRHDGYRQPMRPVFSVNDWDPRTEVVGATTLQRYHFYHLAVTFSPGAGQRGLHKVALFLDGHLDGLSETFEWDVPDFGVPVAETLLAGDGVGDADVDSYSLPGFLADVRISSGIRYPLEDCDGGEVPGADCFEPEGCLGGGGDPRRLIAHWPISEGDGHIVRDTSGHGLHGRFADAGGGHWWSALPGDEDEPPLHCSERLGR